ncbi:MAG: TRAP transporter small permease subunit, partial [Deltaproteobacteria bacterium]|nr:TRAP transporter small permease subunit [Deltaproteobacteria bacterium]
MDFLDRMEHFLSRTMTWIAGFFLVAMVLLTCADVFLRVTWIPIRGSVELVALFGSITTAFALGFTQMRRGHVSVDVVVNLFPEKAKRWLGMINAAVGSLFFAIVAWRIAAWSTTIWRTGELTETLR